MKNSLRLWIFHTKSTNKHSVVDDFDFACEYGYGQFVWNSAQYLDLKDQPIDLETSNSTKSDHAPENKKSKTAAEKNHERETHRKRECQGSV